jgi:hypothetical protein
MQRAARLLGIASVLAFGGCAVPDMDSFKAPDSSIFKPKAVAALRETVSRPVTAEDLVDADGRCAAAFSIAEPGTDQAATPSAAPLLATGIALEMTECDVVKRAGPPERVEIGSNERSERTATLTYIRGARPGVYNFNSGRLVTMERAPEPPAPTRPARPSKPAPKPKRAAT